MSAFIKTQQIKLFTLTCGKVVYFKKHLTCIATLRNEVPLPLNVLYHCQIIKLAEGAMAEPLQTLSKEVLRNLLLYCI